MPDHEVHGDGGTTLFLLHGAYGSKEYFRDVTAALVGAGLRVVAWDAPGYGLSPLPADGLAIPAMAEAAARLVEHAGSATNVILGHSMGGMVAQALCNRLPGRVHGLVISATVSSFSQKSEADKRTFLAEQGVSEREVELRLLDGPVVGNPGDIIVRVGPAQAGVAPPAAAAGVRP